VSDATSQAFPPRPTNLRQVRAFTRAILAGWDVPSAETVLIINELATNAIRYAQSDFVVSLRRRRDLLIIEVVDKCSDVPLPRGPGNDGIGGRGLAITEALSRAWGFHADLGGGKVVWAEIDLAR
jgi:anti-sigma regulatory factor (Ser/Thr protein kinase)